MAQTATCPEIKDFLAANECLENFGGLGVNVYIFIKDDLVSPLKAEKMKGTAISVMKVPKRFSPISIRKD